MRAAPFDSPSAPPWRRLSPLGWLIAANVAVFVLQSVFSVWFKSPGLLEHYFGLSASALARGWVWTALTYAFLHEGVLHIVLNMLVLAFSWRPVSAEIGERRCLWAYMGCVLGGALLWMLVSGLAAPGKELVGASAGAFGVFTLFCLFYWERPITFLLFFVFPLTLKPKWVLMIFGGMEVFSMLFQELPARLGLAHAHSPIAFSAHVGGLLTACALFGFWRKVGFADRKPDVELPAWLRRGSVAKPTAYRVNFTPASAEVSQAEVNRILDKIAASGFASLTPQERERLDRAHEALRRRRGDGPASGR